MSARGEFKTVKEAEHMLSELRKASRYCTGPKSSVAHEARIAEVEAERDRLETECISGS